MGEYAGTRIDVAALRAAADRFDGSAAILDAAVRAQLGRLRFAGARAGRAYTADGEALRHALDQLVRELRQWSRASTEIALTLRGSAERYRAAEQRSAARAG